MNHYLRIDFLKSSPFKIMLRDINYKAMGFQLPWLSIIFWRIKMGKLFFPGILFFIITASITAYTINYSTLYADTGKTDQLAFTEIWGYLMRGEEKELSGTEPFTDICYFSASINSMGRINTNNIIKKPAVKFQDSSPRYHIVISELSNAALMHFCLAKGSRAGKDLIKDIVTVSREFDGVQIDFESILPVDAPNFYSFLKKLKKKLKNKTLSIAVPARTKDNNDAFQYSVLNKIVDRIIIMAYDQHWSTSLPGPVASKTWCEAISLYAVKTIDKEKIIMGVPLYGRAWQEKNHHRAYKYSTIQEIVREKKVEPLASSEKGLFTTYEEIVKIFLYFDDITSITDKLRLYKDKNVQGVSFWRIGYGPKDLWENLQIETIISRGDNNLYKPR